MGRGRKEDLLRELALAVSAAQEAVDAFDEAAAHQLGLNRTDLRSLSVLVTRGALPASELALKAGLSRPATTTAIDRLEASGYVQRVHDDVDRRRVLIKATPLAIRAAEQLWGPLMADGLAKARRYRVDELRTILDYLRFDAALQASHAERIRELSPYGPAAPRGRRRPVAPSEVATSPGRVAVP